MLGSLRFIGRFILMEKRYLIPGVALTGAISAFTWLGPKIIADLIDRGLVPGNQRIVLQGVVFLAFSEVARLMSVFLSQVVYSMLGQNVIERVRGRMITQIFGLPVRFFDENTSGSMMTRVVYDVNSLTDFFQSGFVSILGNAATVSAIFFGLFMLNIRLGVVLLAAFIPIAVACVFFSRQLRKGYEVTRNELSNLNSMLADFLFGMKTIRSLGVSFAKHRELNAQIRKYAEGQMGMVRIFALFQPTLSLGIGVLTLLLIGQGIPQIHDEGLKIGEWVAALNYVVLLQQPLTEISDRWNFFLAGVTSIERIRTVFSESQEKKGGLFPEPFQKLEFHDVSFQYRADQPALSNVDLVFRRGDWVGIYGPSGSGKSTLLQMIYGFYPPARGRILWNGRDLGHLDLGQFRKSFGVVEQFPFLFGGTVRENITLFGEHECDLEGLRNVFRCYPLIESILKNPDLPVRQRGANLSMGQKQMIAFLRAWMARPEIWILDEATAFFDHDAQTEVFRALNELRKNGITVIQVAHRPEALGAMNRLIWIQKGRLEDRSPTPDLK